MGPASRSDRTVFAVVGLGALLLHATTACATVYFGDSGELIAAAHSLGVAHPPGYPLYTLLGRLALWVPLGEAAWRMNMLSAGFAALTCAGVAGLVLRWTGSRTAAVAAGLSLAASASFWSVATVAEVYTMHLFLVVALLICAERFRGAVSVGGKSAALLAAAVTLGLGLSHRPTILLALPAALWLARGSRSAGPRPRRAAWLAAAVAVVAIPALMYGTLMLRSRGAPAVNWGSPDDLRSLVDHLGTRSFKFYVLGPRGWARPEVWSGLGRQLGLGSGFLAAAMALVGIGAGLRRGRLGTSFGRGALSLLALAVPVLLFGLSYGTEDIEVLFLPICAALAAAAGLGLGALQRPSDGGTRLVVASLAAVMVATPLVLHHRSHDLRGVTAAADYGRDMLNTIPVGGAFFVEGDDSFLLAYLVQVLGEREDVTVYDRLGLMFGDQLAEPGSSRRKGEAPLAFRIRRELEFLAAEMSRPDRRGVFFMAWPGFDLPPALRFEPVGLLYAVRRASERPVNPERLWSGYREATIAEAARRIGDPFALTVAAIYPLMRGERALFEGDRRSAVAHFDLAGATAPGSETIHNLLGTIYGRSGDYARAIGEFELALRAKPVSPRAWNNLGLARQLAGDLQGARDAWRRSLELLPDQPDTRARLSDNGG